MKWTKSLLIAFLLTMNLHAQTAESAVASTKAASDSHWQNWIFAATGLVTATAAVLLIAFDNGNPIQSH